MRNDGYEEAKVVAADAVCAAGHELQVVWARDHYEAACVTYGCTARAMIPRRQLEQDMIRERFERDPQVAHALAVQGAKVPLTSTAIRELSDEQLGTRVDSAFATIIKSSPEARARLIGISRSYELDPLFDLQWLYDNVHITYDGRMRKLRGDRSFRGEVELRPLSREEKDEWGYAPEDLVVVCKVDMGARGIVTDYGVVRAVGENSPVAKQHKQLIAIKRARARVSRIATGIDLPTIIDVDTSGRVMDIQPVDETPRPALAQGDPTDRERRRFWAIARAEAPDGLGLDEDRVHELLGVDTVTGYAGGWTKALADLTERAAEAQAVEPVPKPETEMVTSARSAVAGRYADIIAEATRLDVKFDDLAYELPIPMAELTRKAEILKARIQAKKEFLANPPARVEAETLV